MKSVYRYLSIVLLAILFFTSCEKKDKPVPVNLTLSGDKTSFNETAAAGKDSIQITSNTTWTITGIPSWVTVSASTGSGNLKVYINYTANAPTSARTATITLSATGVTSVSIQISQAGATHPSLSTDKSSFTELSSSGKDSFQVSSNTSWTISNIPSWITVTPATGTGNTKVYINYTANTTSASRSALLNISATGVSTINIPITQNPNATITSFTSHAAGGASIILTGTGFTIIPGQNIITINGITATVTSASFTALTVTVPAKCGSGQIQLSVNGQAVVNVGAFTYDWVAIVTTFAGSGSVGNADGTGTNATFNGPFGIEIDPTGNVYVAEFANNKIRKVTPAGDVSTFAGSGRSGSADGTATTSQFSAPTWIAIDATGNLYVSDYGNNKIRKITSAGDVSTFAGNGLLDTQMAPEQLLSLTIQ